VSSASKETRSGAARNARRSEVTSALATVLPAHALLWHLEDTIPLEVTVKLVPRPQLARCIMASFDDMRKAGDAVANVIAAGIIPAGLEMMDKPMTAAVENYVHAGYDLDAVAILLCESDGTPEEVAEEIGHMEAVLGASGATRIQVSQDEAQRLKFWSGRKNAFPATGRLSPDCMCRASMASGSRSCRRCACSSRPRNASRCWRSSAPSTRRNCSIPAR
jgi:hypothetical protein